ncbi:alpha/beta fold hydrolase, partial [Xanthovirga aplysinae]|uniref:alpha/beta fold hydrolase n=1 Tax=Xanthovirga aplysinae TaxID=2529853 RepID=UPI0012BCD936
MSLTTQTPEWLDTISYPFENKYIALKAGRMHYVDEGKGDVILFLHGTPTWSFLYRDFIKSLSQDYRCIAIDHIGFGLSEKPKDFVGTPQEHCQNLSEFIQKLDLKNITLVAHDFGGPIGLGAAIKNPDKIKKFILFNTWLWETKNNPAVQKVDKIINSRLGRFLYLRMNFSPKTLLKKGFFDKKKLTKKIHKQYLKPFPDKNSRYSLLRLAESLIGSSDWYEEQWKKLKSLKNKPWLILWGNKD